MFAFRLGRIGVVSTAIYSIDRSVFRYAATGATNRSLVRLHTTITLDGAGQPVAAGERRARPRLRRQHAGREGSAMTAAVAEAWAPQVDARPTALLPATHLLRISAYWLGLTAIDAVGRPGRPGPRPVRPVAPRGPADDGHRHCRRRPRRRARSRSSSSRPSATSATSRESRWGRRKPYIVLGSLFDVLFLLGIAYSNTLLAIAAFSALLAVSTNMARGPFQGYVPDLVAEPQVGTASALVGMMQVIGNVTGRDPRDVRDPGARRVDRPRRAWRVIELVTMLSVVLRVGRGHAAAATGRADLADDRAGDVVDRHPPGAVLRLAARRRACSS